MSLFGKIKDALKKTREGVSTKLRLLFAKNKLGEEFYDELEEILISADVSVRTAEEVVEEVKEEAIGGKVKDQAYVTDLLKDILEEKLEEAPVPEIKYPCVIMFVGVNGVGKTTTIGKVANYFVSQRKSVTVAAADTFRAAASDQLSVWAERANVRIVKHEEGSDPSAVIFDALSSAKARGTDVVLVDTAGRLHVKENLMKELQKMDRVVTREFPEAQFLKFLVLDATTGQNAVSQARVFDEAVELDGIVLTKLDGTAKGGFVFSLCSELNIPVVFTGVGEKMEDLVPFDAEQFVEGFI
ncbi:MAG TPA: signal recognition particle-docking protein FtsY [Candidatus Gallimonas gallistercoris]|uniref:Signal recognition particle receptor FtsY n=1 Tax=Candidatus Gallimonas gallistercoris TaxID=2838602 RepID=A0A9D2H3I5_9FIRM|nr:signal recognition particle-docking protein FtsY [Candidatus Gallimonas gallistercoris]